MIASIVCCIICYFQLTGFLATQGVEVPSQVSRPYNEKDSGEKDRRRQIYQGKAAGTRLIRNVLDTFNKGTLGKGLVTSLSTRRITAGNEAKWVNNAPIGQNTFV